MTQEQVILQYLQEGNSLTPLEALDKFRCFRLASRISFLKQCGHNIQVEIVSNNGKRFAKYWIPRKEEYNLDNSGQLCLVLNSGSPKIEPQSFYNQRGSMEEINPTITVPPRL